MHVEPPPPVDTCRRTVLIIGGSGGIGWAIASGLADDGATVGVMSRTPPPAASERAKIAWQPTDLAHPNALAADLAAWSDFPVTAVDAVFVTAVAYGERRCRFLESSDSEWQRSFTINVDALSVAIRALVPILAERPLGGVFVGLTSEVVWNAGPGRAAYAASKAAAHALLASLAIEVSDSPVRIVQLMPSGMIRTPGIERRRPAGFNYSGYGDPALFVPIARRLVHDRGTGDHGRCLVVQSDASTRTVDFDAPPSQSRSLVIGGQYENQ